MGSLNQTKGLLTISGIFTLDTTGGTFDLANAGVRFLSRTTSVNCLGRSDTEHGASSFWSLDGKPISAAQFIEGLYGQLPEFFQNEEELRTIWCNPGTSKRLLQGLEDKGFGGEQLTEAGKAINAHANDIFDVLDYIAFALPPQSR